MVVVARYLAWLARLNLGKLASDLIRQKQYILTWRFLLQSSASGPCLLRAADSRQVEPLRTHISSSILNKWVLALMKLRLEHTEQKMRIQVAISCSSLVSKEIRYLSSLKNT